MPNWCMNNITVSHKSKKKMQRFVDAYNKGGLMNDFNPIPEGYLESGTIGASTTGEPSGMLAKKNTKTPPLLLKWI